MKNVKGILVNSKEEKVSVVNFNGDYYSIHDLLGKKVDNIDWIRLSNGDIVYYDMDQKENYNKKSKGFEFDNGICFRGNCIIVGDVSERTGNHINVKTKITDVRKGTVFGLIKKCK